MKPLADHGLSFSAPMIRAFLAGTKTQTRRLVKVPKGFTIDGPHGGAMLCVRNIGDEGDAEFEHRYVEAPHGPVGRIVYAKETWCPATSWYPAARYAYRADYEPSDWTDCSASGGCSRWRTGIRSFDCMACNFERWRPSIHMPKWATRIWLRVVRVRLERVQAITEEDARAEGCTSRTYRDGRGHEPAIVEYRQLWDTINGARSWASNPWVWAYDFERIINFERISQ